MLRFQRDFGAEWPLFARGERQCSVFWSVFGTFERECSVFYAIFLPFSHPKVGGFNRREWVGMLRFRQFARILHSVGICATFISYQVSSAISKHYFIWTENYGL